MNIHRQIEVMQLVADDMAKDAAALDGQPFDGKTVAVNFGQQMAAIRAVALAVKSLLEERAEKSA